VSWFAPELLAIPRAATPVISLSRCVVLPSVLFSRAHDGTHVCIASVSFGRPRVILVLAHCPTPASLLAYVWNTPGSQSPTRCDSVPHHLTAHARALHDEHPSASLAVPLASSACAASAFNRCPFIFSSYSSTGHLLHFFQNQSRSSWSSMVGRWPSDRQLLFLSPCTIADIHFPLLQQ
jgi:hypothetical protein